MILISTKQNRIEALLDKAEGKQKNEDFGRPQSYVSNDVTEELCMKYLKNFETHFTSCGWEGKLLLYSNNEFGITKPICTTLKPTLLRDSGLFDLENISAFVSRHIAMEQLEDKFNPPRTISSPTSVMKWRRGDSFECSILLASILLGANYDAYIVIGSAPDWLCNNDLKMCAVHKDRNCPFNIMNSSKFVDKNGYSFRDNSSGHIHSWVLVRGGARSVEEMIYIEPASGLAFLPEDSPYGKIFSIYNNRNIWIHKPIKADNILFDLFNQDIWHSVFRKDGSTSNILSTADITGPPTSWVEPITIQNSMIPDKEVRINFYHMTKQELFHYNDCYTHGHGSIIEERRTYFTCENLTEVGEIHEWFQSGNKSFLEKRERYPLERKYYERFRKGHKSALKEITKQLGRSNEMTFFSGSRLDGLIYFSEVFETSITCDFEGRSDCLKSLHLELSVNEKEIKSLNFVVISPSQQDQLVALKSITQSFRNDDSSLQYHPSKYVSLIKENKIVVESFPLDDRSIPVTRTLSRSIMNENSPEWMTASECEKKCIKHIRSIYFEMLSIMSTHGEDQRFTENIPEIHARSLNDQVSNEDTKSDEKDDWLSPFIATNKKFNSTNKCFSKEHAMEIKNECLKAMKERLDERKTSLQVQIHKEHKRLSSLLHGDVHDNLRCKILEKRLQSHEELVSKRLQELEYKIKADPRFEFLV